MADTTFLEADLRERPATDQEISFWLALLLSVVTFGLWTYYVIWQLVSRRDRHFRRVARLAEDATAYLRDRSQEAGADLGPQLARLSETQRGMRESAHERGALIWTILCLLTSGVAALILYCVLMGDYRRHQAQEEELVAALNDAFNTLGEHPGLVAVPEIPERSCGLYIFLTIITFGLFGIYWYYCLIEDPNRHFRAQAEWEQRVETALV